MNAATFLNGLNDQLQSPRARGVSIIDDTCDRIIPREAPRSVRVLVRGIADAMVLSPSLIARVVYPYRPPVWPIYGKNLIEVLCDCRERRRTVSADVVRFNGPLFELEDLRAAEDAIVRLMADETLGLTLHSCAPGA